MTQTANMPSDPYEALLAEIDDKLASANEWIDKNPSGATTKEDADWARNVEAEVQALLKRANDMHSAEKAPHLEAGRDVDQRFSFRKSMDPVKKALRSAWGTFAAAEEARLQREAAAKEAERRRAEAERQKIAETNRLAAMASPPPEEPEAAPIKVNVGGGVGSRGGLTTVWFAKVEDYQKAAAAYSNQAAVRELIDRIANAQAKRDKDTAQAPGVVFSSERRPK